MHPSHDPGWRPLTLFVFMVACLGRLSGAPPPAGEGSPPTCPAPARPRLVAKSRASGEVHTVALSPDGHTLAAGGRVDGRGVLQLWDLQSGSLRWALMGQTDDVLSVAFSRDGTRLATGSEPGWVRIRDARSGKLQRTLGSLLTDARSVAFSPDGQRVAGAGGDPLEDEVAELKLWDARTGRLLRSRRREGDFLNLVTFLPPEGPVPPPSDEVGTLQLWDTRPGGHRWLVVGYDPTPSQLSPDGTTLADAGGAEEVTLRDARTLRVQRTLQPHGRNIKDVAFSADSKTLAVAAAPSTGNELELWEVRTGRLTRSIPALGTNVSSLAYRQDGRTLMTGDERGALELWDANSRRWLATLLVLEWEGRRAPQWIAYSPGGYYEGSSDVERLIRWRVGGQLLPGERYERTFRRPDLVRRALQGRPAPTPIPVPGSGE